MADAAGRRIPEATVARLPLYYRALLETAEHQIATISSERLAELAGVNAAKVRKDLSYLGSYGTRGVGYDVEYLLHEISRELGLTRDWPVAIVGIGNLGRALANYRGFGARGFRIVALIDADPGLVGAQVGDLRRAHRRSRAHREAERKIAIGILATPARGRPGRRRSPRRCGRPLDPELRAGRAHRPEERLDAQGRPRDRAADPVLLPTAAGRRAGAPVTRRASRVDARRLAGFPVNLLVRGRRVVVVGAGRIAARKIEPLLELGAEVHVVAPRGERRSAGVGRPGPLLGREREFGPDDLDGALARPHRHRRSRRNAAVHAAGEAARVWVNSADDPANCSFTLMSVVRRSDLVVAIGTGGRSPALAAHLRRPLNEELGPEYETLLDLLSEAREAMRASGRSSEDADWQRAFESGIVDLVRAGRIAEAKELLSTCLSSSSA